MCSLQFKCRVDTTNPHRPILSERLSFVTRHWSFVFTASGMGSVRHRTYIAQHNNVCRPKPFPSRPAHVVRGARNMGSSALRASRACKTLFGCKACPFPALPMPHWLFRPELFQQPDEFAQIARQFGFDADFF